jgi:hypothetical protein
MAAAALAAVAATLQKISGEYHVRAFQVVVPTFNELRYLLAWTLFGFQARLEVRVLTCRAERGDAEGARQDAGEYQSHD